MLRIDYFAPRRATAIAGRVESLLAGQPSLGAVSDPITTPSGTAIVRVVERVDVTPEQIAAGRDQMREELAAQRQDKFFSAYMQKVKTGLKINIKQDVLAQVVGGSAPATPPTPGLPPLQ